VIGNQAAKLRCFGAFSMLCAPQGQRPHVRIYEHSHPFALCFL
jgi:hypothetical protein